VFSAVVFAYSEVGKRCLTALLDHGVQVPLVFTHEDAPGETHWYGSVAEVARAHGVPMATEAPAEPVWRERVAALAPHYVLSFYYRSMLDPGLLAGARWGALNMHGSLLPRYRGRAPVNWAILNGETTTGATLHYMTARPDAGPIVAQQAVPIGPDDDALRVSLAVAAAAQELLVRCLPRLAQGPPAGESMDLARGSYFGGRRPEDGRVDWSWPVRRVHDLIRAVAPPFPGAFTDVGGCRIVFAGSRSSGETAHPDLAPCLYAADGQLFLDCRDGRLCLPAILIGTERLTAREFPQRFGPGPLRLVQSRNRS
jgi:methionyl-tRNA formyltransferase